MPAKTHDFLDSIDLALLGYLQRHARASHVALSRVAHLSAPQCFRRLRRLEKLGVIQEWVALLDRERLGFGIMAWVSLSRNKEAYEAMGEFEKALRRFPEVLECYSVTGDFDYLLKVVTSDLKEFSSFLRERLLRVPGVVAVRSAMCLEEIKHSTALPLTGKG
ncbi:MAG: Lrp/AsnC family transcriptional regulator [Terriglobales bacterium]